MIGMSDQTHLSNLSGDKKAWPVYLTLRNLPATRRNTPGPFAVVLLALLPVPHKLTKSSAAHLQKQINADTLRGVFQLLFEPLQNAAAEGVKIECADGKVRRCFPIFSAWIADHMENVTLHGIKSDVCPKCEVLPGELGTDANSHGPEIMPDMNVASLKLPVTTPVPCLKLLVSILRKTCFTGFTGFRRLVMHKPDLLHPVYLGLFKHLMDWIPGLLKQHARLQAFNDT